MDSGGVVNAGNEVIGEIKGIVCFDVKYKEDKSLFISSTIGIKPLSTTSVGCPFLSIVIGSPFSPELDQLLPNNKESVFAVLPNLIINPIFI